MRKLLMGVAAALFSLAFIGVTTSVASATVNTHSLWVAPHAANGDGRSCAQNGFSSISAALAVAAPNAMIHVCAGTYTEQPQITEPLSIKATGGAVTVAVPASPVVATTSCDSAMDAAGGSLPPDTDGISVCTSGTVKFERDHGRRQLPVGRVQRQRQRDRRRWWGHAGLQPLLGDRSRRSFHLP